MSLATCSSTSETSWMPLMSGSEMSVLYGRSRWHSLSMAMMAFWTKAGSTERLLLKIHCGTTHKSVTDGRTDVCHLLMYGLIYV